MAGRVSRREPAEDGRRGPGPSARDTPSSDASRGEPQATSPCKRHAADTLTDPLPAEGAIARFAPIPQPMAAVIQRHGGPLSQFRPALCHFFRKWSP